MSARSRTKRRFGDWLTREEAGRYLGVSTKTIYNWVSDGLLVEDAGRTTHRLAKAELEGLRKRAAARGVSLVYQLRQDHNHALGRPDGRRREAASA